MTTYDPANIGSSLVLSNGNLTIIGGASGHWEQAYTTSTKTSGKFYAEQIVNGIGAIGNSGLIFAIGQGGGNLNSFPTASGENVGAIRYVEDHSGNTGLASGIVTYTDANTPIYSAVVNDVIQICIDITAGKAWVGFNNSFGGSPSAGTNPAFTWTPAGSWMLIGAALDNDGVQQLSLRPSAATQSFSPPSGFTAWDSDTLMPQIWM